MADPATSLASHCTQKYSKFVTSQLVCEPIIDQYARQGEKCGNDVETGDILCLVDELVKMNDNICTIK